MSESIKSENPFIKGITYWVIMLSYSYYILIAGQFLNKYIPKFNLGYIIVVLVPLILATFFHISGIYKFSLKVQKRHLSKHENSHSVNEVSNLPILHNDPYGIIKPISEYKEKLEEILNSISVKHFAINDEVLVSLYTHGLFNVKERFWTTTYLTSGFWTHGRTDVITANKAMLDRLHQTNNKSIKRLFLLKNSEEEEIKHIANKVSEYKNQGPKGEIKIKEMFNDFESLKNICQAFESKDCEIKYYFDGTDHNSIGIIKNKTEIALYDNFRIDYFDGGDDSEITGVKIYHEKHRLFNAKKEEIITYFDSIWKKSNDISILFNKLENALIYYSEKIDYTYSRLLKFNYNLNIKDSELKNEEMLIVKNFIEQRKYLKNVNDYLDIGTCTGRYPFTLSEILINSSILGIDADEDCVEFCNIEKMKYSQIKNIKNILFKKIDFLYDDFTNGKFNLITCMLGTISHFGWNKKETHDDDLQKAINKMKALLSVNGILIISNWTDFGLSGNILEIYNDYDRKRLRSFTEKSELLKTRLETNFEIVTIIRTPNNNLDIFFCKKSKK